MKKIILALLLLSISSIVYGASINKINGVTIGTSTGNYGAWNGLTASGGQAYYKMTNTMFAENKLPLVDNKKYIVVDERGIITELFLYGTESIYWSSPKFNLIETESK